ncbi:unnamed protein product [Caenorhabditis auriculariae]|uniref:Uncharacterized protein n=1 Tax=Caenorhabditis auriculariae TaxID=2777116 RepID=A0A8S1GRD0_9PELO|nr:unnamed protein product [Caenorhabditis auriculariae]
MICDGDLQPLHHRPYEGLRKCACSLRIADSLFVWKRDPPSHPIDQVLITQKKGARFKRDESCWMQRIFSFTLIGVFPTSPPNMDFDLELTPIKNAQFDEDADILDIKSFDSENNVATNLDVSEPHIHEPEFNNEDVEEIKQMETGEILYFGEADQLSKYSLQNVYENGEKENGVSLRSNIQETPKRSNVINEIDRSDYNDNVVETDKLEEIRETPKSSVNLCETGSSYAIRLLTWFYVFMLLTWFLAYETAKAFFNKVASLKNSQVKDKL